MTKNQSINQSINLINQDASLHPLQYRQIIPKPIFTGLEAIAGDDDERVLQVKDFEAIGEMANSLLVKVCKQIKIRKLNHNFVIV